MRWIDSRRSGRRQRRKMVDVSARPTTARATTTDVPVTSVSAAGGVGPLVLPVPPAAPERLVAFAAYVPGPND